MDTITIAVDADVAQAYRTVSASDRRKLDLLVNLRLREATRSSQSLREIMQEISRSAQERGLTPEILRSLSFSEYSEYYERQRAGIRIGGSVSEAAPTVLDWEIGS